MHNFSIYMVRYTTYCEYHTCILWSSHK